MMHFLLECKVSEDRKSFHSLEAADVRPMGQFLRLQESWFSERTGFWVSRAGTTRVVHHAESNPKLL